jgi:hypothetical protein
MGELAARPSITRLIGGPDLENIQEWRTAGAGGVRERAGRKAVADTLDSLPRGGAYAQCDGGLCFRSAEETTFPGFDKPVPKGQIICSCPITDSASGSAQGY